MVRRHPPGAARTCRKGEFPSASAGPFLPCSGGNDSRTSGLEFLFINAQVGSVGKALNTAPCGNAPGSFDVRSLIERQISGSLRWPSAETMPFLAWFLPVDARPPTQPVQGGFAAVIDTEPVVADGRTCL